jgi:hypothetical protein
VSGFFYNPERSEGSLWPRKTFAQTAFALSLKVFPPPGIVTIAIPRSARDFGGRLTSYQGDHLFFVNNSDPQLPRLVQLRARIVAGHNIIRLLADGAGDLAAGIFY